MHCDAGDWLQVEDLRINRGLTKCASAPAEHRPSSPSSSPSGLAVHHTPRAALRNISGNRAIPKASNEQRECLVQRGAHAVLVEQQHLMLRRVNIHVKAVGGHRHVQKDERFAVVDEKRRIGLINCAA